MNFEGLSTQNNGDVCFMLIKCPDCGSDVSDKARVCLNCGRPIYSIGLLKSIKQHMKNGMSVVGVIFRFLVPLVVAIGAVVICAGILELGVLRNSMLLSYGFAMFICIYYPFLFLPCVKWFYGLKAYSMLGWGGFFPCLIIDSVVLFGSFLEVSTVAEGIIIAFLCGLLFIGYLKQLNKWSPNKTALRVILFLSVMYIIVFTVIAILVLRKNMRDYKRIMKGDITIEEMVESAGSCYCSKCIWIRKYNFNVIKEKYVPKYPVGIWGLDKMRKSALGVTKRCTVEGHTLNVPIPLGWEEASKKDNSVVAAGRRLGGGNPNNQFILLSPSITNKLLRGGNTFLSLASSQMSNRKISFEEFHDHKSTLISSIKNVFMERGASVVNEDTVINYNWVYSSFYINVYGKVFNGSGFLFINGIVYVFHFSIMHPRDGEVDYLKEVLVFWLKELVRENSFYEEEEEDVKGVGIIEDQTGKTIHAALNYLSKEFTIMNQPTIYTPQIKALDKEFLDKTAESTFFDSEDTATTYLDDWCKRRFGFDGMKGLAWNVTPDGTREAYGTARQYGNALIGLVARGYEAVATPEYINWMKAKFSNNREEMIKLAKTQKTLWAVRACWGQNRNLTANQNSDDEIGEELKKYGDRIEAQNFIVHLKTFGNDFTSEEIEIVFEALRNGNGIPMAYADRCSNIIQGDREKANRVLYLINLSRNNFNDHFVDGICTGSIFKRAFSDIKHLFNLL